MGGTVESIVRKRSFVESHPLLPPPPRSPLRRIAEVAVGDETGTVTLRARNGQVDFLLQGLREAEEEEKKPFVVVVRNAGVAMYKGYMRLIVNKWGKLSRYFPLRPSLPPLLPLSCVLLVDWRGFLKWHEKWEKQTVDVFGVLQTRRGLYFLAVACECLCCIRGLSRMKGPEQRARQLGGIDGKISSLDEE